MRDMDTYALKADKPTLEKGKIWYANAHEEAMKLAQEHHITLAQASGIISKLSPGIQWNKNIEASHKLLLGESTIQGYKKNVEAARQIARGEFGTQYEEVLNAFSPITALKTRNFYINIYNPLDTDAVTLDRWMIRAAKLAVDKLTPKQYFLLREQVITLSQQMCLLPNQTQAIIWLSIKQECTLCKN